MPQESDHSHLFVVRVWTEQTGEEPLEHRGRVQHALSGETRHFRDWPTLVEFLVEQMAQWEEDDIGGGLD